MDILLKVGLVIGWRVAMGLGWWSRSCSVSMRASSRLEMAGGSLGGAMVLLGGWCLVMMRVMI